MVHILVAVLDADQICRATWWCGIGMGGGGGMGARPARVMTLRMFKLAFNLAPLETSPSAAQKVQVRA